MVAGHEAISGQRKPVPGIWDDCSHTRLRCGDGEKKGTVLEG